MPDDPSIPPAIRNDPDRPRESPDLDLWAKAHADALWRYALSRTRRLDVAEELVQETFLAAIVSKDQFEQRSSDLTWLIGILRNKIADHYRKSAVRSGVHPSRARDRKAAAPSPAARAEDPLANVASDVFDRMFTDKGLWRKEQLALAKDATLDFSDRQQFVADLARCSEGVPVGLWEAFLLREAYGVETEEVCKRLSISATNLWSRIHRAKALLRECLAAKGWWGGDTPP